MRRRTFLASAAAAAGPLMCGISGTTASVQHNNRRTFATPAEAAGSPRETLAYVAAAAAGAGARTPDYLATVDLDPTSRTYSQVVHRLRMPHAGDELHHFGWNACASCHCERARRFPVIPGLASGRIHAVDTVDPLRPMMHKVIEPAEVIAKARLTGPHTVHCLSDGRIMVSMLGDERGDAPGGFLLLDERFEVAGRWEASREGMCFNYDFWYQPRHHVMVSSEWAAPNTAPRVSSLPTSRQVGTAAGFTSGTGRSGGLPRASTSARRGWSRWRSASTTTRPARTGSPGPPSRA